jgi:hypothetical protein
MPPRLLRLGQYLLIAAMFCALGGHWLVLQTVAWGGMIVDYSRQAGFTVAVGKTFDGQHPCQMCKSIAKTRQTEKKQEAVLMEMKLDVFHEAVRVLVAPKIAFWEMTVPDFSLTSRSDPPSIPPPRKA